MPPPLLPALPSPMEDALLSLPLLLALMSQGLFSGSQTSCPPAPFNESSAEAKGSWLWDFVVVDCTRWLNNWPCVRVYYLRPVHESWQFACFSFFLRQRKQNRRICLGGKKNKRFFKRLWITENWSILEPPDLDSVPLMLYKHLFWVFNKLPADKL